MIEIEFKVLMFAGTYVDYNLLDKGIYTSSTPKIFSKDYTITKIVQHHQSYLRGLPTIFGEGVVNYVENLRKCELVTVYLTFKNKEDETV